MMFRKRKEMKAEQIATDESESLQKEVKQKRRRKPQDQSKLTRNSQVQIRLTEAEVAALKAVAKENNMTLADFVMSGVNQTCRVVVPGAGELRSEIIRLGNNLNQALKLAHIVRKEGQLIDTISIEVTVDHAEMVIEKLNKWLTEWNVNLTYKIKKEKE